MTAEELGVKTVPNYGEKLDRYPIDVARFRGCVERVTELSRWADRAKDGRSLGLAVHHSFVTYVAVVASVVKDERGKVRVDEAWVVADAGTVVNPDRVKAMMEGAVIFGMSLALHGAITMKNGAVEQTNFRDYRLARMPEAPRAIHVDLIESSAPPGGAGEPGLPLSRRRSRTRSSLSRGRACAISRWRGWVSSDEGSVNLEPSLVRTERRVAPRRKLDSRRLDPLRQVGH